MMTIITSVALGLAIGGFISLGILFYAKRKAQKRNSIQEQILQKYTGREACIIRYATQKRFNSLWKLFPWEATGVLYVENNKIICEMKSIKGVLINLEFETHDVSLNWLGRKHFFKNGLLSWFCIGGPQEKHYFTSETGSLIVKSKNSTEEIFTKIKGQF